MFQKYKRQSPALPLPCPAGTETLLSGQLGLELPELMGLMELMSGGLLASVGEMVLLYPALLYLLPFSESD